MIGATIGAFRLVAPAGVGGQATVWRALHLETALPFAVKLLHRPESDAARAAFTAELATIARLDHPAIVRVVDHGWNEGGELPEGPWLAMSWAARGAMPSGAMPSWQHARSATRRVLDGLAYAHARGVLHRDLKPANVLSDDLGRAWLADFGLAGQGASAGTPAYMAPEQVRGRLGALGPWTDLYALGGTLWTWVTGAPPFGHGLTPELYRQAQMASKLPELASVFATPEGLAEVLACLLARDPGARYRCAADAAWALDGLGPAVVPAAVTRRASAGADATWTETGDPAVQAPELAWHGAAPAARPFPEDWRGPPPERPPPAAVGAALRLLPLRRPPEAGREAERDRLWSVLSAVARDGRSRAVGVEGAQGVGRHHLAAWLATTASELGAAGHPGRPVVRILDGASGWPEVAAALAAPGVLLVVPTALGATPPAHQRVVVGPCEAPALAELLESFAGLDRPAAARIAERSGGSPGEALRMVRALQHRGGLLATPTGVRVVGALPEPDAGGAPEPSDPHPVRAAEWWLARGRPDRAISLLAAMDPSDPTLPAGSLEAWDRAVALAPEAAPHPVRARFAVRAFYQAMAHGAIEEAEAACHAALALADGDPEVRALGHAALAGVRAYQGRAEEGWALAAFATRESAPASAAAMAWGLRGQLAARTGRWDDAIDAHRRAVALRSNPRLRAGALGMLACSAVAAGRLEAARAALAEAAALPVEDAAVDRGRGVLALAEGDLPAAEAALRRSIAALRTAGRASIDLPLLPLARVALATHRAPLARDLARETLAAATGAGHAPDATAARVVLIVASIALGLPDDARAQLDALDVDVLDHLVRRGDRTVRLDRLLAEAAPRAPIGLRARLVDLVARLAASGP